MLNLALCNNNYIKDRTTVDNGEKLDGHISDYKKII